MKRFAMSGGMMNLLRGIEVLTDVIHFDERRIVIELIKSAKCACYSG